MLQVPWRPKSFCVTSDFMPKSVRVSTKKRGRPKTTGKGELIGVRILPPLLKKLDAWINSQVSRPSRPEAIRGFLERGLAGRWNDRSGRKRKAEKASELATRAAERVIDKSMPPEEQQRGTRALITAPQEFREIREDLPKSKTWKRPPPTKCRRLDRPPNEAAARRAMHRKIQIAAALSRRASERRWRCVLERQFFQ